VKQALIAFFLTLSLTSKASPPIITPFIRIDQFGYLCNSRKVAVIVDPQVGYNANDSYSPGTGTGQYQLRRWLDDEVVFTGTLTIWNNGATQAQSGDKGWWFDFSSVTLPGSYYVYDLRTRSGSYRFEIGANVYDEVLKQACRMFYYQRCNFAKDTPYADPKWTDAAAFEGALQDRHARSRWDKNNPATEKDVSGGWFDAGDLNKYVILTVEPLTQLLETYRLHPSVFQENLNLPESGNGIPDILDEVKFELDWLEKMQDATGTGGLMLKVGSDNFTLYTPPSTDINKRYYLPECTSATLSGAAVFALAANIYRSLNIPSMATYADDLQTRAVNAWSRAQSTTSNFTSFQTDCDDQNIIAGDADQNATWQKQCALSAAVYLYEGTGSAMYKTYVESNYINVEPVANGWWGPYAIFAQKALLRYTKLGDVSVSAITSIRNSKQKTNTGMSLPEYSNATDLYRAHMPDAQYTWGSNMTRSACGANALDYVQYGINTGEQARYKELAEQYLHWLHGVNPEGIVMISNMYAFGGDSAVNEIFHTWFADGTIFDNAKTSPRGPAPGFITGGPNREFSVFALAPPANQPPQKAYKDWNTNWNGQINENSFEITEPAIYYQGMYIQLLAAIIDYGSVDCSTFNLLIEDTKLTATAGVKKAMIQWPGRDGLQYDLQRSYDGNVFTTITSFNMLNNSTTISFTDDNLRAGPCSYRLLINTPNGGKGYSNIERLHIPVKPGIVIWKSVASNFMSVQSDAAVKATLNIYTSDSRLVQSTVLNLMAGEYRQVDIKHLPHGNYWVQIRRNTESLVKPIIW
jgi:endoglucanase